MKRSRPLGPESREGDCAGQAATCWFDTGTRGWQRNRVAVPHTCSSSEIRVANDATKIEQINRTLVASPVQGERRGIVLDETVNDRHPYAEENQYTGSHTDWR